MALKNTVKPCFRLALLAKTYSKPVQLKLIARNDPFNIFTEHHLIKHTLLSMHVAA